MLNLTNRNRIVRELGRPAPSVHRRDLSAFTVSKSDDPRAGRRLRKGPARVSCLGIDLWGRYLLFRVTGLLLLEGWLASTARSPAFGLW